MKKLDGHQIDWLLESFFINCKFAGSGNIGRKLIETGKCITTEQSRNIWIGGVGNFIKKEKFDEGFDLIRLTFDLNNFLESEYFKDCKQFKMNSLNKEYQQIKSKKESIFNLQ